MVSDEDKRFLEQYSDGKYEKPSVTVDAVIFRIINKESDNYRKLPEKKLQVFLMKRTSPPYKDLYALAGTFIDLKTELNETLKMCVKNKVGLKNYYFEQLFTFGDKTRDPRTRVLSISYMLLTGETESLPSGKWFDVEISDKIISKTQKDTEFSIKKEVKLNLINETEILKNKLTVSIEKINLEEQKNITITKTDIAFDHIKMIYYALERLKNKLEYTDIIFNLLPEKFSLTELKQAYELILREKLLDANFRRKISKLVRPTEEYITGKGFRSSRLFEHNPLWSLTNLD
ncbi:MAG: ADP-ribose pyrophosphatase [Clostridia bacterium]|nr:ADP-ribose pyrophosphatase [Clostridia bacterium]